METRIARGNCILRVKQIRDSLKSAERQLADYILENPEVVISETMENLAAQSGVSYATVNRFYKKLGYTGFRQFKDSLIYDVINSNEVSSLIQNLSFGGDNTIEGTCENAYKLAFKVLDDSLSILDTAVVDAVVHKLIHAQNICFIGAGYSGLCARYAYSRFFRIGLNCITDLDSTLFKMQVSLLNEKDVLFVISSSGRTETVVEAARLAKKNNVTVVALSDFAISPLSKTSDYNLYTTSRNANLFLDIDMPLITGQITIIDMLYMCCTVAMGSTATSSYEKTNSSAMAEKLV
ncbi:MurR/RpiR family transcriptional regulator [Ruminococcaceae bacterium OttesenSCG-928-A11]|nr:MurR/RpiR family transcriptional regulator [Ruminococcaceae bacterium OttesenSCG-928-A11]